MKLLFLTQEHLLKRWKPPQHQGDHNPPPTPPCHGTLGPRQRAVNEVTSALDAMKQEKGEEERKSGQNAHGLGALGEEEQNLIQT